MSTFTKITFGILHLILSLVIMVMVMRGITTMLEIYREVDIWLEETLGWGSVALILTISFLIGRTVSLYLIGRWLIPWIKP